MLLIYPFFFIQLFTIGFADISEYKEIINDMNILLQKPKWQTLAIEKPNLVVMYNNHEYKISDIISTDEDGKSINEINAKEKIGLYYILLGYYYSDMIRTTITFFTKIYEHNTLATDKLNLNEVFLKLIHKCDTVFSMMKSSLYFIFERYYYDPYKSSLSPTVLHVSSWMTNFYVNTVICELRTSFEYCKNANEFYKNLHTLAFKLNQFDDTYIKFESDTSIQETIEIMDSFVKKIILGDIKPDKKISYLSEVLETNTKNFVKYFEELGFGYNALANTSYVLQQSKISNKLKSLQIGLRSCIEGILDTINKS